MKSFFTLITLFSSLAFSKPLCVSGSIDISADLGEKGAVCIETKTRKATLWDAQATCARERKSLCNIGEFMAATAYPEMVWSGAEWLYFKQASTIRMMSIECKKSKSRVCETSAYIYWGEQDFRCCYSEN